MVEVELAFDEGLKGIHFVKDLQEIVGIISGE